ncbi:MAG: DNA-binding protein [Nitrososphaerales archaeon]
MSEMDSKTQLGRNNLFSNNEKVMIIQRQPFMDCALDVITNFASFKRIILKAKGDDIPTAVAVTNMVTETMMKDNSEVVDITVDSENAAGKYGMTLVSTIQITIAKKII